MKKFLTTAFLFTLAVAAFAQGVPVQKSLFEGQFVAHLSLAIAAAGCGLGQGKAVVAACGLVTDGARRTAMAAAARRFALAHRGATEQTVAAVRGLLG